MQNVKTNCKEDIEDLVKCPWCASPKHEDWGAVVRGFRTVLCKNCGLIYVKNRLNLQGLEKYYSNYLKDVHQADQSLNMLRDKMYELEFQLIEKYIKKQADILDVGCSGGYFLDRFKTAGFNCYGVELGDAAALEAGKKHTVYHGDFAAMNMDHTFDVIIFRGVIEHISYPRTYLGKAVTLLNKGGLIYITSTPNSNSYCCKLFKELWNQHEPEAHLMHFNAGHFDEYFSEKGMEKILEHFFYEETPYADIENDILAVGKAIEIKRKGGVSDFRSPAFFANMMSVIYRKNR